MEDTRAETGYQSPSVERRRTESTESTRWQGPLLKRPPLIKPRRMPNDILGDHYEIIKEILRNFAKSKAEWDDYAKKIDPVVRREMANRFEECRENGFYGPHIGSDGEIHFAQLVQAPERINEVYRVEETMADGSVEIKRCAKEYLRPNMKIIDRIK